ncbi:transmembrane protein 236 [Amia ocellicauda]|uniref:transmembrane protein 236 n=1 Tax=Amia ocellicauda TaxID=2972642 RepID=UPI0034649DB8|nr:TM236 protein [Amia calva]
MGSGKKIKFALFEVLQFAALCVPVFIIMQRFASVVEQIKSNAEARTAYWLIVASSIAYVMTVTLVIWVPMKYMIVKKRKFLTENKKWRPVTLAYVVLSTLPCFAFLIASSEVQINSNVTLDRFTELPVSLVLFSLICVDIIDRLRKCRLTGQVHANENDQDIHLPGPVLTHMEQVATVSGQVDADGGNGEPNTRLEANGSVPGMLGNQERQYSISGMSSRTTSTVYHNSPNAPSGPLKFLCNNDMRAELFVDSFMYWFDTIEMVRVAGDPQVYYSGWVIPIYIFSYISLLRLVLKPKNPALSSLGVFLQDIPFLFIRIALIAIFGYVTPLLYLLKNLLVFLAFIYFNFMTKLKMFNTERMF